MIQKIYSAIRKHCCHVYLGDITLLSIPLLSNAGDNNKVGFGSTRFGFSLQNKLQAGFPSSLMLSNLAASALIQPQAQGIQC